MIIIQIMTVHPLVVWSKQILNSLLHVAYPGYICFSPCAFATVCSISWIKAKMPLSMLSGDN